MKSKLPRFRDESGYLTRIDLRRVAENLTRFYERPYTSDDARMWLVAAVAVREPDTFCKVRELSPFVETDQHDVLASVEDPHSLLRPEEILTVRGPATLRESRRMQAISAGRCQPSGDEIRVHSV